MNKELINLIFKAVGLAMGVATLVLSIVHVLDINSEITMLAIGVSCLGISQLKA